MSITGSIVIYVIVWWIVFFSLLPIDVNRNKYIKVDGEDSGSPENPKILKKFINLRQSENELKNKLEQMRAIDNDIKINVALATKPSIGIDTVEDYVALKKIMEYKS